MFIQDWLHRLKRKYENMRVARSIRSVVKNMRKPGHHQSSIIHGWVRMLSAWILANCG